MNKVRTGATLLLALSLATPLFADEGQTRVGGVLEVEMDANTIATPVAELAISRDLGKYVAAEVLVLYEDGITAIDTAAMNLTPEDSNWSLRAGDIYIPFGKFDSYMVSDPLTLSLGETREAAIQYAFTASNLSTSIYLFNGSNNVSGKSALNNFGLQFTHASAFMAIAFGYIDDIGDSNAMQNAINTQLGSNNTSSKVAGQSMALDLKMGAITFNTELVSAVSAFQAGQLEAAAVQPLTISSELAYHFHIAGNESVVAIGSQSSKDANALGIPKSRLLLGWYNALQEDVHWILQASQDTDYSSVVTTDYAIKLVAEF
ncbi:MAG: LbtU family siderophore porin [Gammaproteobacteria bacterium]|nr:LbtU family siderophore porin [Gammaproteobacteria bacterium]